MTRRWRVRWPSATSTGRSPGVPPDEIVTALGASQLGIFGFAPQIPTYFANSGRAVGGIESAAVGDLNRDGRLDVLVGQMISSLDVAWRNNKTATFMPKPIFGDNGSGMHCHQSIWNDGEPLFYDETGYAGLSDMARYYIGGILAHAPSLLAFTNPTVNSYHRLVPGFEAPVNLVYSQRNRSACVRIPITGSNPKAKRIEFRCPDPSANPYLAFSAMLLAGLDGIKNKIEPHEPVDKDLYGLPPDEHADIPTVPALARRRDGHP